MSTLERIQGRNYNQLRPLHITHNKFGYSCASVLFELGDTKVNCCVTLQSGVPQFLRGKGEGWLTAEYEMLPTATAQRSVRESATGKRNARSLEISRLIGRSLRAIVDLTALGERTITIDCEVLQADGGTRTACISGAYLALERAQHVWLSKHHISRPVLLQEAAAISVGIQDNRVLLDIDFSEDSQVDADYNFVMTRTGHIIEMQGTAEKKPVSWEILDKARMLASEGIEQLFAHFDKDKQIASSSELEHTLTAPRKAPLFSLQNRQNSAL